AKARGQLGRLLDQPEIVHPSRLSPSCTDRSKTSLPASLPRSSSPGFDIEHKVHKSDRLKLLLAYTGASPLLPAGAGPASRHPPAGGGTASARGGGENVTRRRRAHPCGAGRCGLRPETVSRKRRSASATGSAWCSVASTIPTIRVTRSPKVVSAGTAPSRSA